MPQFYASIQTIFFKAVPHYGADNFLKSPIKIWVLVLGVLYKMWILVLPAEGLVWANAYSSRVERKWLSHVAL